jgi:hypothetical protein
LKQQVHQTLGKEGVIPQLDSIWRASGQRWLDDLQLADASVDRIESLRDLIELDDREISQCDARSHRRLKGHPGYEAIQALRMSAPSWPRRSSPRSATCPGSTTRAGCARGLG